MKLEYIKTENITDVDLLDNITDVDAILLHEIDGVKWWIEVNYVGDNTIFYVPNGWDGFKTGSLDKAISYLEKLING